MSTLPDFPVDDATLLALEHAMGGALTFDRDEHGEPDLDNPQLVGADYSLSNLLDFLSGTTEPDPNAEVIDVGEGIPGIEGARIIYDTRPHYHEHDIIRALITEVRRLRQETP